MKVNTIRSRIRRDIHQFGVAKTAYEVLMEGVKLCVDFRIRKAMKIETVHSDLLESKKPLQWQFFDASRLWDFCRNPDNKMSESFVPVALEKGDECYGAVDGEVLACYGWYSSKPTDDCGVTVHFGPEYVYLYSAYTSPGYRGQRLYAIGINRALREYIARGFKGCVCYVESHNVSSLRSVYRVGYRNIGLGVSLRLGSHVFTYTSRGCREQGMYLAKPESAPARTEAVVTA